MTNFDRTDNRNMLINSTPVENGEAMALLIEAMAASLINTNDMPVVRVSRIHSHNNRKHFFPLGTRVSPECEDEDAPVVVQLTMTLNDEESNALAQEAEVLISQDEEEKSLSVKQEMRDKAKRVYEVAQADLDKAEYRLRNR